jgi:PilZ domain
MATHYQPGERRKEMRYPLRANVIVRTPGGEAMQATASDISSSGMKLHFAGPCPLARDQEITVEVELSEHPDKSFSSWGVGRIAYVDRDGAGIQLAGGQFEAAAPPDKTKGELA